MIAIKSDPKLWETVKKEIQGNKKWNARLAQQSVQEYKRKGGKYLSAKSQTSLNKWTNEQWSYVTPDSKRYLPKKVIEKLTPAEKSAATRTKKKMNKKYEYPPSVNKLMKQLKIY